MGADECTWMFICTLKFSLLFLCSHAGRDADLPTPAATRPLAFSNRFRHNSAWGLVKEGGLGIIYSFPYHSLILPKHTFRAGIFSRMSNRLSLSIWPTAILLHIKPEHNQYTNECLFNCIYKINQWSIVVIV